MKQKRRHGIDGNRLRTGCSAAVGVFFSMAMVLLALHVAEAQQRDKLHRIGILDADFTSVRKRDYLWEAFRRQLQELGWVEGRNVVFENRYTSATAQPVDLVADLVRVRVDVLVTSGIALTRAAKEVTTTIPIVMTNAGDPVSTGLVTSLARPDGNITGLSSTNIELGGKRLEFLKEAFPRISNGVLGQRAQIMEIEIAARALGLSVTPIEVRNSKDLDSAVSVMNRERVDVLIVVSAPTFFALRTNLAELALKHRLSAMYPDRDFVTSGGLMSYGPSMLHMFQRAAFYVDKILKGFKPSDLPIEQPTKFELVINLKAAEKIGLTIPDGVLRWADAVIR